MAESGSPVCPRTRLCGRTRPTARSCAGAPERRRCRPAATQLDLGARPRSDSARLEVDVRGDGVTTVAVAPPPARSGSLVVRANVEGALVRVDGREVGFTPLVAEGLRPAKRGGGARARLDHRHHCRRDCRLRLDHAGRGAGRRAWGFSSDYRIYESLGFRGFSPPGDYTNRVLVLVDGHPINDVLSGRATWGTTRRRPGQRRGHRGRPRLGAVRDGRAVRGDQRGHPAGRRRGRRLWRAASSARWARVMRADHRRRARARRAELLGSAAVLSQMGIASIPGRASDRRTSRASRADGESARHLDLNARLGPLHSAGRLERSREKRSRPAPSSPATAPGHHLPRSCAGYAELRSERGWAALHLSGAGGLRREPLRRSLRDSRPPPEARTDARRSVRRAVGRPGNAPRAAGGQASGSPPAARCQRPVPPRSRAGPRAAAQRAAGGRPASRSFRGTRSSDVSRGAARCASNAGVRADNYHASLRGPP